MLLHERCLPFQVIVSGTRKDSSLLPSLTQTVISALLPLSFSAERLYVMVSALWTTLIFPIKVFYEKVVETTSAISITVVIRQFVVSIQLTNT